MSNQPLKYVGRIIAEIIRLFLFKKMHSRKMGQVCFDFGVTAVDEDK